MKKFTFKTVKPTGKWKSFDNPQHLIKLDGSEVGTISYKDFKIRLMVIKKDITEDGNKNCIWKWIMLKKEFNSLDEAKIFLNNNINQILKQWELYKITD
jgi:hypothetical protein